jgi:hypothetical protein
MLQSGIESTWFDSSGKGFSGGHISGTLAKKLNPKGISFHLAKPS